MARRKVDQVDRPKLHPDAHADADPSLRWTTPNPPRHEGREKLVTRPHGAAGAVYVRTGHGDRRIWISPGETAYASVAEAKAVEGG